MADAGETRTDRRTTDTRARIEATALELFTRKGFAATSLRDIAEALGITKAALYYHFPAKADLATALVQPFLDDVDAFMAQADGAGWSRRRILEAYLDALVPHLTVLHAVVRDASLLAHVDLGQASVRWLDGLPELFVGENASPGERVAAVVAVAGLGRAMMMPGITAEQLRTAGVDAALRALAPDHGTADQTGSS